MMVNDNISRANRSKRNFLSALRLIDIALFVVTAVKLAYPGYKLSGKKYLVDPISRKFSAWLYEVLTVVTTVKSITGYSDKVTHQFYDSFSKKRNTAFLHFSYPLKKCDFGQKGYEFGFPTF